jgi:hypothetical protein
MSVTVTSSKRLTQLRSADAIVSGSVTANSFVGALTGNASTATTAATVTDVAQPSITSVGTLSTLNVSGHITASGNISASGTGSFARVGIGTASPTSLLTVGGSGGDGSFKVQASTNSSWFSVASGTVMFNDQGGSTKAGGIDLGARFNIAPVNDSIPTLAVRGFSGGVSDIVRISSPSVTTGDYMIVKSTGNVGIGTTSPGYKLSVAGTIQSNAGTITGYPLLEQLRMTYDQDGNYWKFETTAGPGADLLISQNATPFLVVKSGTGRVGIGTTSPGSKLQVYTGNTANANDGITLMRGAGLDVFGIKHRSDAGGIYRGAITYDAAEVMTFLSAGNVGIGTGTPTAKLHVAGNIWASGSSGHITASANISASGTGSFGMVGIGTTSPGAKLDVNGAQIIQSTAAFGTGADQAALYLSNTANFGLSGNFNGYSRNLIKSNGSNLLTIGRSNSSLISELSIESGNSGLMKFLAGGSERMRITSAGNVGIGTTSPPEKLTVQGNISASGFLTAQNITASNNINAGGTGSFGMIGIGKTNPAYSLDCLGNFNINGSNQVNLKCNNQNVFNGFTTQTMINSVGLDKPIVFTLNQGITEAMRIAGTTGNVGIGTTTPTAKLHVAGNIWASGSSGHITASANISASGNIYSDELWLNDKLRIYNTTAGQRISGSGEIFFASNKFEFNDVNISLESQPEFMRINGDTNILGNVTSSGTISSSLNDANHVLGGQLSLMGTANGAIRLYAGGNLQTSLNAKGNINSYINAGGNNLGIGTAEPTAKLHVVGNILATTNITASGNISASGTIIGGALQFIGTDTSENATHYLTFKKPGNTLTNITNGISFNPSTDSLALGGVIGIAGQAGTITGLNSLTSVHITASGDISASGNLYLNQKIFTNGATTVYNNGSLTYFGIGANATEIDGTNIFLDAPVTASGNISASGTITANNINGTINGGTF